VQDYKQPSGQGTQVDPPDLAMSDLEGTGQPPRPRALREPSLLEAQQAFEMGGASNKLVVQLIIAKIVERRACRNHETEYRNQRAARIGRRCCRERDSGACPDRQQGKKLESDVGQEPKIAADLRVLRLKVRNPGILLSHGTAPLEAEKWLSAQV
jgi:hypothetical protein